MSGRRGSTRAWRRVRAYVLARDGYACQRIVSTTGQRCLAPATDAGHIVAHALGGTDHPDNLRAECLPCNRTAGGALRVALTAWRTA